jgi:predicted ArsR family transcriptional regulator
MTATDPTLRALVHPVRLRMMSLTWTGPQSAAELARELGISQALASQHLRRLAAVGLVELAEVRPDRGGQERRYQAVHDTSVPDQRQDGAPMLAEVLSVNLRERAARRAPSEGVTTDAELWLSPDAWDDFRHRLAALLVNLHEEARAPRTAGTVHVGATVMAFPLRETVREKSPGRR